MDNREIAGVRRAIAWLHDEAKTMNDPNAVTVLNNAAFHLGVQLSKWRMAARGGDQDMVTLNPAPDASAPTVSPNTRTMTIQRS